MNGTATNDYFNYQFIHKMYENCADYDLQVIR